MMILNLSLFFIIIPDETAQNFEIAFAIIGGVITLVLSLWMIGAWFPKLFDKIPVVVVFFCISTLFIFGFFFISKTSDYSQSELKAYGVQANAIVLDKTQIYGKRGRTTQSMEVKFMLDNNKAYKATVRLTPQEYNDLKVGMIVPVKFSSRNPGVAVIDYR